MKTLLNSFSLILSFGIVMLAARPARAVDFHVATAQDFQTALTTAAGNAAATNNIYLTNGYYTGNFSYNSANPGSLTVLAETNLNNTQVDLDGGAQGCDLSLTCASNVTVSGITFLRNCGSGSTAAVQISAGVGATAVIQNCQFLSVVNTSGAGATISRGLYATVTNCFVLGSTTGSASTGITFNGVTGFVYVQNCTIATNHSSGIYLNGIGGSFSGNTFLGNYNSGSGGAIDWNNGTASGYFTGNYFSGNGVAPYDDGGAVFAGPWGSVCFTNNTFIGNYSEGLGNASAVGYHWISGVFVGNTFTGNSSAYGAGSLYCGDHGGNYTLMGNTFAGNVGNGSGVGACINDNGNNVSPGSAIITGNSFSQNIGTGGGGAGLYCSGGTFIISSNNFQQNVMNSAGGSGAGLYISAANILLQDNLVMNNAVLNSSYQGGGLYVNPSSTLYMVNNTIYGNTAAGQGGGMYIAVGSATNYMYNNIFWNNTVSVPGNGGDIYESGSSQTYFCNNDVNDLYGVWMVSQNRLNVDPLFFNTASGDLHLQSASPCRNAGTNGAPALPLTDLDGGLRTNSLGQVDLGCYEFNTAATHPADTNANFVMSAAEYAAYAAAWKAGQTWTNAPAGSPNPGPVPANYVTRAGYLMTNGGTYYNNGSARPTNWRLPGQ